MRIHQRTEEEQKRVGEKAIKLLTDNSDVRVKDAASRFGMEENSLITLMKKYGYQAGKRRRVF